MLLLVLVLMLASAAMTARVAEVISSASKESAMEASSLLANCMPGGDIPHLADDTESAAGLCELMGACMHSEDDDHFRAM